MKCIRLEVWAHVEDDENVDDWHVADALGPEVIAWDWHEEADCPTIADLTCPSCGRYTELTHNGLEALHPLACGDCSRVAT